MLHSQTMLILQAYLKVKHETLILRKIMNVCHFETMDTALKYFESY